MGDEFSLYDQGPPANTPEGWIPYPNGSVVVWGPPPVRPPRIPPDWLPIIQDGVVIGWVEPHPYRPTPAPPSGAGPNWVPIRDGNGEIIGWSEPRPGGRPLPTPAPPSPGSGPAPVPPSGAGENWVPILDKNGEIIGWADPRRGAQPAPKEPPKVRRLFPGRGEPVPEPRWGMQQDENGRWRIPRKGAPPPSRGVFPIPLGPLGNAVSIAQWIESVLGVLANALDVCAAGRARLTSLWFDAREAMRDVRSALRADLEYALWAAENCLDPTASVDCAKAWQDGAAGLQAAVKELDRRWVEADAKWRAYQSKECTLLFTGPPLINPAPGGPMTANEEWTQAATRDAARVDLLVSDSLAALKGWDDWLDQTIANCCGHAGDDQGVPGGSGSGGGGSFEDPPVVDVGEVAAEEPPQPMTPPFSFPPPEPDGTPAPPPVDVPSAYEEQFVPEPVETPEPEAALPPAAVASLAVAGGGAQRSVVRSLEVQFAAPVLFPGGAAWAFDLVRTGPEVVFGAGGPLYRVVLIAEVSGTPDRPAVTLTFSGPLTEYGSLVDGFYTLTVFGSRLAGPGGSSVPGDFSADLHRLFGDIDGSATISGQSFGIIRQLVVGNVAPYADWVPAFDFDGDGVVSQADYVQFTNRRLAGGSLT